MRLQTVAGHPVRQYTSPNVDGKMTGHKGVVLHIAEGGYEGTISWQMNPDQRYSNGKSVTTSSTWIVGREQGQVAQMSDSGTVAWCQRDGSYDWNSIELAGFSTQAPTEWQREACAHLFAWAHGVYGVPLQVADDPGERGLGHHSMDREWPPYNEEWGHEQCPGAGVIAAKPAIVARAQQIVNGDDDMANVAQGDWDNLIWRVEAIFQMRETVAGGPSKGQPVPVVKAVKALQAAVATGNTADATRDAELRALVEAAQSGQLDAEQVLRRMGELLTAAPAAG